MDTEVMKHMDRAFFLLPYKHVGNTGRLEPENLINELYIHFSSIQVAIFCTEKYGTSFG